MTTAADALYCQHDNNRVPLITQTGLFVVAEIVLLLTLMLRIVCIMFNG
mgnify:CR=1 FL=1